MKSRSAPSRRSTNEAVGVILAGGRASRMFGGQKRGGDKGLLDLGGKPMLAHVIARFAPQVSRLVLNANGDPSRLKAFALPIVADAGESEDGPLAGLLAGMRWASANAPGVCWIATVSTDMPFLPMDLVARLLKSVEERPDAIALAARAGRTHFVAGLWPVARANDLAAALARGERKVMMWAERHETITVEFPIITIGGQSIDPFFNANSPEELAEARRLIESLRA